MSIPATVKAPSLGAWPSIDQLLRTGEAQTLRGIVGARRLTALARSVTEDLRSEVQTGTSAGEVTRESLLDEAVQRLSRACAAEASGGLKRVINATGVLIHTNLV